jgi:hypothetical protein
VKQRFNRPRADFKPGYVERHASAETELTARQPGTSARGPADSLVGEKPKARDADNALGLFDGKTAALFSPLHSRRRNLQNFRKAFHRNIKPGSEVLGFGPFDAGKDLTLGL